jgi:hypothetical protein
VIALSGAMTVGTFKKIRNKSNSAGSGVAQVLGVFFVTYLPDRPQCKHASISTPCRMVLLLPTLTMLRQGPAQHQQQPLLPRTPRINQRRTVPVAMLPNVPMLDQPDAYLSKVRCCISDKQGHAA